MVEVREKAWTYQCQACGEIKNDIENFEPTGSSEICLDCEEV